MRGALLALVLLGCGDNEPDPVEPRSGSRLQLVEYDYGNGMRELDRDVLLDRELDLDCRPRMFSDGTRHCLPDAAGGTTRFIDASCTRSIGVVPIGAVAPPLFIRYFTLAGTQLPSRVYRAGDAASPPAQIWELLGTECFGPRSADPGDYYTLGDEVELVHIRESERVVDGRVALGIDTSDDGLRMPAAFYDRELGDLRCDEQPLPNAQYTACVPRDLPRAGFFSDAQCRDPVVSADGTPSTVVHQSPTSGCWSLHGLGEPISGVFEWLDEMCVQVPLPANARQVTPGPQLVFAQRVRTTSSQLELVVGKLRLADRFMFDPELGAECRRIGDACVPAATIPARVVFADAACMTAIKVAFVPKGTCEAPSLFASDDDGIYRVGAPHDAQLYELEPGDRCGTYAAPPRFAVYDLGPALDPETFPHAARRSRTR